MGTGPNVFNISVNVYEENVTIKHSLASCNLLITCSSYPWLLYTESRMLFFQTA